MSDAGKSQHSPADSGAVTPGNVASSPISSSRTKRYKVRAGCGRSGAAGESSEEGADQGFFLDDEGTSVTTEMLAQLRKAYDIPSSPFFAQILNGLGVAPAQLSSMAWRNLAGLYILWKEAWALLLEDVYWSTSSRPPGESETLPIRLGMIFGLSSLVIGARQWSRMGRRKWTRDLFRDIDLKSVREYVVTNPSEERLAKVGLIPPPSSGALGDEILTPSSITRRMAEGSKTDLAFLQLVRDRIAKAVGASSQRATTGSEGHFSHASRALPALKQVLEFSDSEKGSEVVGLSHDQAIDMASHLFLHGSFLMSQFGDKLREGSTSVGRVAKLEAQLSRLTQKVKDKDDQILKLEDQLGEVWDELGSVKTQLRAQVERANELQASMDKLETEALVAKFGKEQNLADVAGSSRQLTSGHPLNLEVSPPHSDQEEDDSDDEGSQSGKGEDT
ncbi:hypothetical protein OWV82_016519 [Melia azedarach]|uniref:Uncharacterized protein n=1 Tax=Melia azedarach TaxID=155640 RepID=A0ACC1XHW6_MELAZ|nr:hypothetical protein OWV82_016519 [Melia azedarach]